MKPRLRFGPRCCRKWLQLFFPQVCWLEVGFSPICFLRAVTLLLGDCSGVTGSRSERYKEVAWGLFLQTKELGGWVPSLLQCMLPDTELGQTLITQNWPSKAYWAKRFHCNVHCPRLQTSHGLYLTKLRVNLPLLFSYLTEVRHTKKFSTETRNTYKP